MSSSNPKNGVELLRDPLANDGLAMSREDRISRGVSGLMPFQTFTDEQLERQAMEQMNSFPRPIDKYIFLQSLHDRNERLFYRVVVNNVESVMPLIYTPVVGEACQKFAEIFRRPRGLYVSIEDLGRVDQVVAQWPHDNVRVVVVTDGERILGLGDLGVCGMGIPIGKLNLYVACAGIAPSATLPITLDVGTNNQTFLGDEMYPGLKHERVRGEKYEALIAELFGALQKRFGHLLIQFEDFGNTTAFDLLDFWRPKLCTFNDDIQGTAAVTLAGIYTACRVKNTKISDEKVVFLGAGEAGVGIANLIVSAMEAEGLSHQEAVGRVFLVDSKGLVVKNRPGAPLAHHKLGYAHEMEPITSLIDVINAVKPTALIGVSTIPNAFDEEVCKTMARMNERPIIFPLSNPTHKSETTAELAFQYTDGKVLFASGSPFQEFAFNGKPVRPGQSNNAYVFPGIGLGCVVAGIKTIPDSMFLIVAKALSGAVTEEDLSVWNCLFPRLTQIRDVSHRIAVAVAENAWNSDNATLARPSDISKAVREAMFDPSLRSSSL